MVNHEALTQRNEREKWNRVTEGSNTGSINSCSELKNTVRVNSV